MIKKVKEFIKEEWKFLVFLVCFYFVMTYELPFVIYTPGGSINMSERINGDNLYNEEGSISTTYVSMVKARLPFLGLSYIIPDWDIKDVGDVTYDNESLKETLAIDKIYMEEAISNATYVAYTSSSIDFNITKTFNKVTYVSGEAKTNLRHGDIVLSIDNAVINSLKDLQDYVSTKNIGDVVNIKYLRNNKEYIDNATLIDIGGKPKVGVGVATIHEFDSKYNISIKTKNSEAGPSGGLMTTLAIYNQITEYDLTKGKTIMGTGTIEKDGTVGAIGGVKYKLIGAVKNHADVFICPVENYDEAIKTKNEKKYDIIILGVSNFNEALDKIEEAL